MPGRSNAPYWITTRYGGKCNRCKLVVGHFGFPQAGEADIWQGTCLDHSKFWSLGISTPVVV